MDTMKDLPALIKAARERRGFSSQAALALAVGRDQSFVSRFERGAMKELPAPEVLQAFGEVLGLSMEDMLIAAGYLEVPDNDHDAMVLVRKDDPRADLLRLLEGASDIGVRNVASLVAAALRLSSSSNISPAHVPSTGKTDKSESPNTRTA